MPGVSDPYRLLGVKRSASMAQIKAAHRALAKRYHPDAPTADPQRFLRVQEAYQLLTDPLRRREWDARHAPAPMRADEPGPTSSRGRARRTSRPAREPASRTYTWSAGEVPWWEDTGKPGPRSDTARRAGEEPPGPRRPARGPAAGAEWPRAAGSDRPPAAGAARQPADADVYNRSSGAAWSAASRAYFRRTDQDLPRRGSFQYQGSQPLTAARARAAAEDEARRRARQARAEPGQATAAGAPARARRPPAAQPPPAPEAGVARDADTISRVRARMRAEERAAHWPRRAQRARYAVLAWVPLALLVGYGGPLAAGCQAGACPAMLAPAQALLALLLLGALLLAPRVAYAAALATTALALAAGGVLLGAWLVGVRAPQLASLPPWALVAGSAVLAMAYLVVAGWLLGDRQRQPWAAASRRR